eukprot:TRINITY_DN3481_c0_g2_i2.p1 TRINITY_DN3481_c0_g2~~TRINITY_DN3481_c0_g2_i2.p1  ORF type:complete len:146 (+),score=48.17 TRINITY_DN3481_c0_g2_i2:65-439(+)
MSLPVSPVGVTSPVVTKHPRLDMGVVEPPPATYRDVNVVRPNFFVARPGDTDVNLREEHNAAVQAVEKVGVADSAVSQSKWTTDMRDMHRECFATIDMERYGHSPVRDTRLLDPVLLASPIALR